MSWLVCWTQIRGYVRKIVDSKVYRGVVLLLIVANSIQLLFQSVWENQTQHIFLILEWVFLSLFTLEMVLGILAYGLVTAPDGYLRSFWNLLDVLVVVAGWVTALSPAQAGVSGLRAFRVLRPLRSISRVQSVKILVETMGMALPSAANVIIMMLMYWYVVATIGLHLWAGIMHRRCYLQLANTTAYVLVPDQEWACTPDGFGRHCGDGSVCLSHDTLSSPLFPERCATGQTLCPYQELRPTYDNIAQSLLISIQCLSQDNWPNVLLAVQNGWADMVWVFFAVIMVLSTIVTNLFVGVLYTYFSKLRDQERLHTKAVPAGSGIANSEHPAPSFPGRGFHSKFRSAFVCHISRQLLEHRGMQTLFTLAIFVNVIILALDYYKAPASVTAAVSVINSFCLTTFILELLLKWMGLGLPAYSRIPFNILDFLLIVLSCVEFVATHNASLSALRSLRGLKVLRLLMIGRLVPRIRALSLLLRALAHSVKAALAIFLLSGLMIFVFTVLGVQLFGKLDMSGSHVRFSFRSPYHAFVTVCSIFTGEDWADMAVYTMMQSNSWASFFYFLAVFIIGAWILVSLLISAFVDAFKTSRMAELREIEVLGGFSTVSGTFRKRLAKLTRAAWSWSSCTAWSPQSPQLTVLVPGPDEPRPALSMSRSQIFADVGPPKRPSSAQSKAMPVEPVPPHGPAARGTETCRARLQRCMESKWAQRGIMVVICASCVCMALVTYDTRQVCLSVQCTAYEWTLWWLSAFFTLLFALEMGIKMFAYGPRRYWLDPLDCIDGLCVIASGLGLFFVWAKAFRVVRAIRLLVHLEGPRRVVVALVSSVPVLLNMFLLVLLLWYPFAVIGMQLFKGSYWTCSGTATFADDAQLPAGMADCPASHYWVQMLTNFDNIFSSLRTIHILSTADAWTGIMWSAVDRTAPEGPQVEDYHPGYCMYFILFYFLGGLLPLQMLVGAIVDHFSSCDVMNQMMTDRQLEWVMNMRLMRYTARRRPQMPANPVRGAIFRIVTSVWFGRISLFVIVVNLVFLSMEYYEQPPEYATFLQYANDVMIALFALEVVLKLIGLGPRQWAQRAWHWFEGIVTALGLLTWILRLPILTSLHVIRVIRLNIALVRLVRVVTVIQYFEEMRIVLWSMLFALPAVCNMLVLQGVLVFMFSIFGVALFGYVPVEGNPFLARTLNFQTVGHAMPLLFIASTLEGWGDFMRGVSFDMPSCEGQTCGYPTWAGIYFHLFVILSSYVVMNIAVYIVTYNFENVAYCCRESRAMCAVMRFTTVWNEMSDSSDMIDASSLLLLLLTCPYPFGVRKQPKISHIVLDRSAVSRQIRDSLRPQERIWVLRALSTMEMPMDADGRVSRQVVVEAINRYMCKIGVADIARVAPHEVSMDKVTEQQWFLHHYLAASFVRTWFLNIKRTRIPPAPVEPFRLLSTADP